jgi:hypothetical protein
MWDTSVATVNRHYFNFDEDTLHEIIEGWAIPEVPDVYGSFRLYELEELAAVHFDEFAETLPGFAEAFFWPNHEKPDAVLSACAGKEK